MSKKFKGTVNLDIRDSQADWTPYEQPKPPEGAPNVLFIMWDDTGFASWESYGGLVKMPNMDRISNKGLRYTQFHTTALCSPTRASTLTGRNHTTVAMAGISETSSGFPGCNGVIPFNAATVAEGLQEKGWNTYALGKWHLTPPDELSMAASKRTWPTHRGFDRYYGFLGAETDQWYPDLVQDNQAIDQPYSVEDGYHLSKDLADRAIAMIADAKQVAPDKPFFMYYAPGAGHTPHAPKEWADKYKGVFDDGYDVYAKETFERMKKLGNIIPDSTELAPMNSMVDATGVDGDKWPELDHIRPWDSLSDDEKTLFRRMAEVWAGYESYTDYHIGRILDYLEDTGEMDNTMVIVMSDNGASGEGGPNGSVNENLFFNNIPDTIENNMKYLDVLGGPETYNHYPTGWAQAFCTPFKWYKRYNWNGGVCDPLIISWPDKIKDHGGVRDQYCHDIDLVPTIYEALGIEEPDYVKGLEQIPIEGTSVAYTFDDEKAETRKLTQFYGVLGSRSIYHDGWKANTVHPPLSGWGGFSKDRWELFDVREDRSEMHDLSEAYPDKLQEMINLWYTEAGKYNGTPLDDRTAAEQLSGTPRPQIATPSNRYVYRPNTLEVPESNAVSTLGRSWKFAVEVNLAKDADGVLFSQGSRFGGYSMYIKDNKLKFVYNYVGLEEQKLTADADLPTGDCVLGVSYDNESVAEEKHAAFGTATLFINDQQVAQQKLKTQIAHFALSGEGFAVGRDAGAPVTPDYNGQHPWAFSGGTIAKVTADVSGEAYMDLEKEMIAAMKRELIASTAAEPTMTEPLPSWNDTPTRRSIIDFVAKVTETDGSGFVPAPERIATFDADGTLWCEKPVQIQIAWILQRLAEMAEKDASLRSEQPFKAAYQKDDKWFSDTVTKHYNGDDSGVKVLLGGVTKAFGSMTVEAFAEQAAHFFDTEQHPVYKVSYRDVTYTPMVELLDYLVANGFTPYIVSGGGRDFMRPVTTELFDIPPQHVIGSAFAESYKLDTDGAHIMRGESIGLIDDGPAKAVQIWDHIGRRPILAAGNANGDIPMLEFAAGHEGASLCLLVNHDDSERETDYTAGAEKAMTRASDQDWAVVSVKNDWEQVFSFQ